MLSTINAAANNAKNVSNRTEEHEAEEREASLDEARQGEKADNKADEELMKWNSDDIDNVKHSPETHIKNCEMVNETDDDNDTIRHSEPNNPTNADENDNEAYGDNEI